MNGLLKRIIVLLLAAEVTVFVVLCFHYFPFTPDDSYIYFYGARQLARGELPNYTPGEAPTNPFGSPLWLLLITPSYLLPADPVLVWAKALGILLLVATALTVGKILLVLCDNLKRSLAFVLSLTMLCFPFTVACAVNGLDTMLATFFVVVSLYLVICCIRKDRSYLQAGLVIGFLVVSRPDAFFDAIILAAALGYYIKKKSRAPGRVSLLLLLGLIPGLLLFAATALAYKNILPNSAAAKTPALVDLLSFAIYKRALFIFIRDFSRDAVLYLIYLSLIPFFLLNRNRTISAVFVALSLVHLAIFVLVRDWMGIHRLFLPSFAVALTAFFFVLTVSFDKSDKILLPVAIMVFTLPMGYSHWKYYLGYNYSFPHSPAEKMGRFIARYKLPDSWLLTCDMGVVPYYADTPTIDSNDAPICNRWRREHLGDIEYIFRHKLDFIVMVNARADGKGMPVFSINAKIFLSRYFQENYIRVGVATWRPSIENYLERRFSIGYGRYFHLYVSKRIWNRMEEKKFIIFSRAQAEDQLIQESQT